VPEIVKIERGLIKLLQRKRNRRTASVENRVSGVRAQGTVSVGERCSYSESVLHYQLQR